MTSAWTYHFLSDEYQKFKTTFLSYKSGRIERSFIRAVIYALADGFNYGFIIRKDLETVLKQFIPLRLLTDFK